MVSEAAAAIAAERPGLPRVLGGMSPIDAGFVQTLEQQGVLDAVDVVAVHGFPLDWNHWQIDEWPSTGWPRSQRSRRCRCGCRRSGVSTFGAEEVQAVRREADGASCWIGASPRMHWYSLYDLPRAWPATTRHREAEGSSYYRHFYMGLLREDGTPKRALREFAAPHAGAWDLPVVPLRGPSPRRGRPMAAGSRREATCVPD